MESQRTNSTGPVDITNTQSAARNKTMSETESKVSCPMSKLEQILKDGKDTSPPDATPEPDTEEVNAGNRIKHTFVNEGIQKRAILTLPEVLLLKTSTKRDAEKSIHTVQALAKGTRFGPYEGEIKEKGVVSRFCWEIFRDGKVLHYVDGEDDSKATWMKFVRFASSNEQSNLMAYQHSEQIYFETIHDVPANTELLLQPWSTLSNDPPTPRTEDSSGMKKTSDKVSELNKSLSSSSDKIKELLLDHNENEKITKKDLALSKLHCLTCGKKFQDKHKLRRHQITHTNEKPFACGKCGKRFRRSDTVQTHIKKCHKDPEKWIPVSTKAVPDGKGTKNKSILRKLFQKSGSSHQGTLKCPICDKQISACNFSRHIKVHTRPYKCELCHKRFSRPADGKRHLLKFHKTQDWKKLKYIIDNKNINVIGDKSKDKSEIEHKENSTSSDDGSSGKINDENGTGNGSFECTPGEVDSDVTMSKCFSQPASPSSSSTDGKDSSKLESVSSDDSQASADLSVSKQSITLLTNSGSMFSQVMDDPSRQEFIPMDVSPSSTSNQSSKIIDLTCSTCSKVFSSTSKLNRHKLIHSGLKPHVCEICGRGFSRSEYIKDHKLRMHRNEGDDQEVDPDDIIDISTIFTAFLGDSNDDIKTNLMTISPMTTEVCQLESVYDGGIYIKEGYSNSAGEDSPMMDDENDACNLKEDHTSSEFHHDSSDRNDDSFPVQNEEGLSNQDHITGNNLYFAAAGISQDIDDVKAAEVPAVSYSCKVCARKLDSLLKLRLHMTAHNRSYFCKPCGRKFPQLHSFLSHKLTKAHQDQVNIVRRKNVIAKCQEDKINESLLDDRGTTSLPADQAFSSCHLQESGLTSTQENKCSQCGKGFADPGQLQTHECVPTGNGKLYQCTECGKSFTQSGNLKTHRSRVHARNRDPCPVCGKCFSCLKNHMKVHTGEKPYECIVCGRAFSQSGNLRVHERRQHQLVKY